MCSNKLKSDGSSSYIPVRISSYTITDKSPLSLAAKAQVAWIQSHVLLFTWLITALYITAAAAWYTYNTSLVFITILCIVLYYKYIIYFSERNVQLAPILDLSSCTYLLNTALNYLSVLYVSKPIFWNKNLKNGLIYSVNKQGIVSINLNFIGPRNLNK